MIEVERNKSKTLKLTTTGTATGVTISLKFDWGDVILADTSASGSGTSFSYTLTSADTNCCGLIKATWKYTMSSVDYTQDVYLKVFQSYVNSSTFFTEFPELESDNADNFPAVERRMRKAIDTYCAQEFQYIAGKTLKLDGSGSDYLHVYYRVVDITSVLMDGLDDMTVYVEKSPESDYHIRKMRNNAGAKDYLNYIDPSFSNWTTGKFFSAKHTYHILGNFGWPYVPTNVEEAAKVLIADYFNQDAEHRRHNITTANIGPVQTNYRGDLVGTTGNVEADVLLMDYTRYVMDWI